MSITGSLLQRSHASDPGETFDARWSAMRRWRRQLMMPVYRLADTGLFGLTPLRTHILICGFPRAGTTLLQMMLENGLPNARRFGKEVGGWRAATYAWRNHPIVISKVPHDVLRLQPLRTFYSNRPAELRIILMVRDPRDVLTSQRQTGGPKGYVVGAERWRKYYRAFLRHWQEEGVLLVRYEDLVADPFAQQQRIEAFTGEPVSVPFDQFHTVGRTDFDTSTLNGLRPVEQSLIARWARPKHHDRIEQVLRELPELPDALIRLGYEPDERWIETWRNNSSSAPSA